MAHSSHCWGNCWGTDHQLDSIRCKINNLRLAVCGDILRHASSIESHRTAGLSPDSRSVAMENYGLRGEQRVTRAMRVPITAWVSVNGSCTRFPAFGVIPPKNLKSFCNGSRLHSWLAAVDEDGHYVFAMPLYAAGRQALHW